MEATQDGGSASLNAFGVDILNDPRRVKEELQKARFEIAESEVEKTYHHQYLVRTHKPTANESRKNRQQTSRQFNCYGAVKLQSSRTRTFEKTQGPFTTLAFDPCSTGWRRVKITPMKYNHLMKLRVLCVLWGAAIFGIAILVGIGVLDLIQAGFDVDSQNDDFDVDSHNGTAGSNSLRGVLPVSRMAEAVSHAFFPAVMTRDSAISQMTCLGTQAQTETLLYVYAILLLTIWVPACIVASIVWPLWMMSLQLGATLASDDVGDLMRYLQPGRVKRRFATTDTVYNTRNWKQDVEQPGAMIVDTMGQLSEWGPAMGQAIICCTMFALCMLPHAVARHSVTWGVVCVLVTTLPVMILWAPAAVSSTCDDLLDQLNDISFLGSQLLALLLIEGVRFTVEFTVANNVTKR